MELYTDVGLTSVSAQLYTLHNLTYTATYTYQVLIPKVLGNVPCSTNKECISYRGGGEGVRYDVADKGNTQHGVWVLRAHDAQHGHDGPRLKGKQTQ